MGCGSTSILLKRLRSRGAPRFADCAQAADLIDMQLLEIERLRKAVRIWRVNSEALEKALTKLHA